MKVSTLVASALMLVLGMGGCSAKATRVGCAQVTGVSCDGVMRVSYADGKAALKQIDPDDLRKGTKTAIENMFKPARYVETTQGSTLTFPCGKSLLYYDKECR